MPERLRTGIAFTAIRRRVILRFNLMMTGAMVGDLSTGIVPIAYTLGSTTSVRVNHLFCQWKDQIYLTQKSRDIC